MKIAGVLVDLRNAYQAHDHDAFERHLQRADAMLQAVARPPLSELGFTALEHRRAEIAADLNAADAELERRRSAQSA